MNDLLKGFNDRLTTITAAAHDYFHLRPREKYCHEFSLRSIKMVSPLTMSWIIAGVLICCIALTATGPVVQTTEKPISVDEDSLPCIDDECHPRLLSSIDVYSYEIEYIYNNFTETTIRGNVIIDFTIKEPTTQLIYHAKRMIELGEPVLTQDGIDRLVIMRQYPPNDYISLRLIGNESVFSPGQYQLKQNFLVSLIDGNVGFYQSLYKDGNGTIGYGLSCEEEMELLCFVGNY